MVRRRYARKPKPRFGRKPYRSAGMRSLMRPWRAAARPLYRYKQVVLNPIGIGNISVGAGATFLNAYSFSLNQVGGNLGAFGNLYDQYKIEKVSITFVPKYTDSDIGTAPTGGQLPMIATCLDYDDATIPLTFGDILERQDAKLHRGKMITRTLKPAVAFSVSTGATAGIALKQSPWLDVANTTVPHFGVKIGITGTSVVQAYDIICKYHLCFKQVR